MKTEQSIAKILLDLEAVSLRPDKPFRYTSGMLAPIYTDNRVLISYPRERRIVTRQLKALIDARAKKFGAIAGTSTAGISWAAWLSDNYNVPMVYIRGKAKQHGRKNMIEGKLAPGTKAIVLDDLISTGGSALNSVRALRAAKFVPQATFAIFTYGLARADQNFRRAKVPLYTLTNFQTLVETATEMKLIPDKSVEAVLAWAKDPNGWGKKMGFE